MTAIEIRELSVHLDRVPVLRELNLSVPTGAWVTVIGPNGAGKSTLLRAVAGLVPFQGAVTLDGVPVRAMRRRERARTVALVAQSPVVPPGMAVLEYVLLGRSPYIPVLGRESHRDIELVIDLLDQLDLSGFAQRRLHTLSGGERQRVFLARALAQGATVLLLDEPTSALDIGHQQEVLELVDSLRRTERLTVVSTMHDLVVAGLYAERLVLLDAGRAVACGTAEEVLTEQHLSRHYDARVRVIAGDTGPVIVPVRRHPPQP